MLGRGACAPQGLLAILCGLVDLECALGKLKMRKAFSLLYSYCFVQSFLLLGMFMFHVKFTNTITYASMWHQAMKGFTLNSGFFEGYGPLKAQEGCGQPLFQQNENLLNIGPGALWFLYLCAVHNISII